MKILVVGLGLIGGSLCKAMKKYTDHFVVGSDLKQDIEFAALRDVAVDDSFNGDFSGFDLVIMALFPDATEKYLRENISRMDNNTLITDVCGIKGAFSSGLKNSPPKTVCAMSAYTLWQARSSADIITASLTSSRKPTSLSLPTRTAFPGTLRLSAVSPQR